MISVCIATYNGERYVREQLESILSQLPSSSVADSESKVAGEDSANFAEVIIADDGSTDRTLDIVSEINDPRIRVLPQSEHLGPVYNFERALKAARGDVIFLADQDDVWLPGKVDQVMSAIKDISLVVHDASFMDGEGRTLNELGVMWGNRPYQKGLFKNWLKNSYTGCCMAFKREVLLAALPFPKNLPMHDQWLGLVAERSFGPDSVVALDQPLIQYRVHEKNATHLTGGANSCICQKIKWRFDLLRALAAYRVR